MAAATQIAGAARRRVGSGIHSVTVEPAAEGVWVVRGGFPKRTMNAYVIEDGRGVTVYDAAIEDMGPGIAEAAAEFGAIERVVLGHAHQDHRGAAPALGAPVVCHPDETPYAEADDPGPYYDLGRLERRLARAVYPGLLRRWDGGPVKVSETLADGDEVAGFEVKHLPGHAPGLIALWRESDRLALVSDLLYVIDPQSGRPTPPRLPHAAFNLEPGQARESIRKLASLAPAKVWTGHLDPLVGDVRAQLEHAAATT